MKKKCLLCWKAPRMKPLTAFGLFAVTAMLVCYAYEKRGSWFILAFAFSCGLGSIYGFLQGAPGPSGWLRQCGQA